MSNQNERNENLEKRLTRVTHLQQTTLDMLEVLGQKLNSNPTPEKEENLKDEFNLLLEKMDSIHEECVAKIESLNIKQLQENARQELEQYQLGFEKFKRNIYIYQLIVCVIVLLVLVGNYSIRYYSVRGDHAKYQYVKKENIDRVGTRANLYFLEVDSLYDQISYKNFKIKYDLND